MAARLCTAIRAPFVDGIQDRRLWSESGMRDAAQEMRASIPLRLDLRHVMALPTQSHCRTRE